VTGLAVVDTGTYWTFAGQLTILILIQVGGFGIQALGTLWILLLNRKLGTASRLATQTETGALTPGEVRRVLAGLAIITITVESVVAVLLGIRLWWHYDLPWTQAAWQGAFHGISAFNNAGFALASDSLTSYGQDPLMLAPISVAVVIGGLGFLVVIEVFRRTTGARTLRLRRRPPALSQQEVIARGRELSRRSRYRLGGFHPERFGLANPVPMSLHTRLMLVGTASLIVLGTVSFAVFEWRNPGTLGGMPWWERAMQSVFSGGITPRTAGFNTVDYTAVAPETRFLTDALMFIGAGSGSTAGGLKVTTVMVLLVAARAVIRGDNDVSVLDRRIPNATVRVAVAVTMVSLGAVVTGTMALLAMTTLSLDQALFEATSALATVGLSAEVTAVLPESAQLLLVALMFLGRVGPLTLASSLSLRSTPRHYRLPEGRPMIG
jgi:Trk-type K+ transport system membrane component